MRRILLFLLLISTACSGQKTNEKQSHTDTLKLFDPKPEPPSSGDVQMFRNCLVLFYPNYTVIHNGTEHSFRNIDSLTSYLQMNVDAIKQSKFYLISDSNTKVSKIINAIELLNNTNIDNYKVVNYQEYFALTEPVIIQKPFSTVSVNYEYDSTCLYISILKNSYEIKLLNQVIGLKSEVELNDFISNHKSEISKDKIIIISSGDMPYDRFNPVVEALKKQGYYKYRLATK